MSIAAASVFDTADRATPPATRGVGLLAIATGLASIALLAFHPGGAATDFAGVLQEEAANRVMDAAVHGSFIAVLALQTVCYAVFSRRLGLSRAVVVAGLVFFAAGAAFLAGSMLLDGLVTPAVAARYVAVPAKIESARTLFVLIGTLIGFLMPLGLMFQSAAIAAWGWALAAGGSRALGAVSVIGGIAMLGALGASFAAMDPLLLMGALAGTAAWAVVVGVVLQRAKP